MYMLSPEIWMSLSDASPFLRLSLVICPPLVFLCVLRASALGVDLPVRQK